GAISQRENAPCLFVVIERTKSADLIETTQAVERVEILGIARSQLGRFKITPPQIFICERHRTISGKKMEPKPAPVRPGDALRLAKECYEQQENEVGVDLRLQLEITRKIFRCDFARAALKLERGVKGVVDFLHEHDERTNVVIAQPSSRIVALELLDQPARIINSDVKPIIGATQKCACEFAQFARRFPRQDRQLRTALPIDQAIFQID